MALISSSVLFKVHGGKYVHNQKVSLRPIEHHYEKEGEPENIKYSCQLCENLSKSYPNKVMDDDEQFKKFSFSKGTPQCPCCGINIEWNYKGIRYSELAKAFEAPGIDDIVDDQEFIEEENEFLRENCKERNFNLSKEDLEEISNRGMDDAFEDWKDEFKKYKSK